MSDLFSLNGKIAVVTGAAKGNGSAIAKGLKSAGAEVIGLDVIESSNDQWCNICDITDTNQVQTILNEHPKIDILVNNAGVSISKSFLEYDDESWDKTFDVNLKAPFKLIQMIARKMTDGGSIINITSLNSKLAFPDNPAYIACKGALKQLTKSAAHDLAYLGIRVNSIAPGYIVTDMTRGSFNDPKKYLRRKEKTVLDRWGYSEDLIGASVFLASDASSYITGQEIFVDGGWTIKGL